jgi:hypothetical protein
MTIDEYIEALPAELAAVAIAARRVIDAELPDATSSIKWAQPVWSVGKDPVCYLKKASKHVTLGFWKGAAIKDPSGRLETSGRVMAHTKLRTVGDVDRSLFGDWLRQARELV